MCAAAHPWNQLDGPVCVCVCVCVCMCVYGVCACLNGPAIWQLHRWLRLPGVGTARGMMDVVV